jgi:sugar/nucleoside kinase (ribokinase family)
MRPIAVIGSLSRDKFPGREPRAGGCPYYAARALRLLDRPSRIVARCASEHRRHLLGPLLAQGVPVSWRPSKTTMTFSFAEEGDDREAVVEAIGDPWSPEEARGWVADVLEPCEWIHVAPLLRDEFPPETLAELAQGRFLSLDGQGLARRPALGKMVLDGDYERELLRHVTVLKLAEVEARALLGEIDAEHLAALEVPELIVTRGSRGALVYFDGELTEVPARPVATNVDTTGAGDEFAAIYIASRSRGRTPVLASRRAAAFVGALLSQRLPAA